MERTKKSIGVIIALFIVFSAESAYSQSVSIGARGGISIPNLSTSSDNPVSQGYSSILGGDAAIFVNIRFSDLFSIQPMLEFSQQGGQRNGRQALAVPEKFQKNPVIMKILGGKKYMFVDIESRSELNYLMLPVLAKLGWNLGPKTKNHFRIFVGAGPYVGYLISAEQTFGSTKTKVYKSKDATEPLKIGGKPLPPIDINSFVDNPKDIRPFIDHWNYGISGMVGIAYHFGRNSIFISGGGNYSFNQIQQDSDLGQNHTGAATVSFGYAYKL